MLEESALMLPLLRFPPNQIALAIPANLPNSTLPELLHLQVVHPEETHRFVCGYVEHVSGAL